MTGSRCNAAMSPLGQILLKPVNADRACPISVDGGWERERHY